MIKVLILFETSGAASIPFFESGCSVTTVDILPHKVKNDNHIQIDVRELLEKYSSSWFSQFDLLIAFPPCTYFSKAGLHYLHKQPGRRDLQFKDLLMIKSLWHLPIKYKCFENPAGSALNKLWQPYSCRIDYADYADYKKKTDLWLSNLPPLIPNFCNYKKYGSFITNMSYNSYARNITPIEVGYAMVTQWLDLIKKG